MTIWIPDITHRSGTRYGAIADALAADIEAGTLAPGARLPAQRDLAHRLGVTVGTVTRAYSVARQRGLISGEVGRGTFVRTRAAAAAVHTDYSNDAYIDLSLSAARGGVKAEHLARTLSEMATSGDLDALSSYQPSQGMARHRATGAAWMARPGFSPSPDQVIVCNGAQNALAALFLTLATAGDEILVETFTYAVAKDLATSLGLRLRGLPMDDQGLTPDGLEAACAGRRAPLLYTVPTLQNPTGATQSEARRQALADIVHRHQVTVIEDDVSGHLMAKPPAALASLAPDRVCYVSSVSKCMAAGLRVGYIAAPPALVERITHGVRVIGWTATPLAAEIASRWIEDGAAAKLAAWHQGERTARGAIAAQRLGQFRIAHFDSPHIWMELPAPWRAQDFVAAVSRRGVLITPGEAFSVLPTPPLEAVRICLNAARNHAELEAGLDIIAECARTLPLPRYPIM